MSKFEYSEELQIENRHQYHILTEALVSLKNKYEKKDGDFERKITEINKLKGKLDQLRPPKKKKRNKHLVFHKRHSEVNRRRDLHSFRWEAVHEAPDAKVVRLFTYFPPTATLELETVYEVDGRASETERKEWEAVRDFDSDDLPPDSDTIVGKNATVDQYVRSYHAGSLDKDDKKLLELIDDSRRSTGSRSTVSADGEVADAPE